MALPVGLVWGEADGEIRWHPDEAVTGVIAAVFERFAVCGSVRGVWLWLREQGLRFPLQPTAYLRGEEITWVEPTYHAVHNVLTHPAYAGAYVFGKTRQRRQLGEDGQLRTSRRKLPPGRVGGADPRTSSRLHRLGHLPGQPGPHRRQHPPAGAPAGHRRGPRGLRAAAGPGHLRDVRPQARRLLRRPGAKPPPATTAPAPASSSRAAAPGTCASAASRSTPRSPRRSWPRCSPPRCRPAWPPPSNSRTATTPRSRSGAARSSRPATRPAKAERRYRAVDPDNRLVARGLETEWNTALQQLADAEAELARRETARPKTLTPQEKQAILALGDDLAGVWSAPTTTDKDRKQLLRTLLDEVNISVHRDHDRGPRRSAAALERRRDHRTDRAAQAQTAAAAAHRRGHHRPAAPPGRPLPRRHDRRDPQPATPPHRPRTVVHRQ